MKTPSDADLRKARVDAASVNHIKLLCPRGCGAMMVDPHMPNLGSFLATASCPRCGADLTILPGR